MRSPAPILLFLDFDGVLHPAGSQAANRLSNRPRFEAVMRDHPAVAVVISSTWQDAYSLPTLQRMFSADIAARIIGGTRSTDPDGEAESRYEQIRLYLRHCGQMQARWLALDDAAHEFPDGCAQLVLCDSAQGFDAAAEVRLRDALSREMVSGVEGARSI